VKKYVACAALTSVLFPVFLGIFNGFSTLLNHFNNNATFVIAVCVLAGVNTIPSFWTMRRLATVTPPKWWMVLMNFAAPLQSTMLLIAEGFILVDAGRLESMSIRDWFYLVEAPAFFASYVAYLLVSDWIGKIVPYDINTPKEPDIEVPLARHYMLRGAWFQAPMIFLWGYRGLFIFPEGWSFDWHFSLSLFTPTFGGVLASTGMLVTTICLVRIYSSLLNREDRTLITTDLFALTRHPMYHGMFLADLALFFQGPDFHSVMWWLSSVVFWVLLCTAGWFQEKETLARWGAEAEQYYARTPRFIFEWLWFWRVRQHHSV